MTSFYLSSPTTKAQAYVDYSYSQSITGNYSTVSANVYLHRTDSYTSTGTFSGTLTIDGESRAISYYGGVSSGYILVGGFSKIVYHNGDGTRSCSISTNFSNSGTALAGTFSGSTSFSLNTIPRASTGSSISWTFPNNITPSISSASSSFYHSIGIDIWNSSTSQWNQIKVLNWGQGVTSGSSSFTTTELDYILTRLNYDTTSYNQSTRIRVYTFTDAYQTQIGYKEYTGGTCSSPMDTDITVNSFSIDNTATTSVVFSNQNTTYKRYKLTATINGYTKTLLANTTTPSTPISWDVSKNADGGYILDKLPTSNSGTVTWELTTYYYRSGSVGATIGNKITKTSTASISNNIKKPTWANGSTTSLETNSVIKTLFGTSSPSYLVSGQSKLDVSLNSLATALRGTSIKQYNITVNSNNKTLSGTAVVGNKVSFSQTELKTSNSSLTMTLSVVDNRGNMTTLTPVTFSILQYTQPAINFTASREGGYYPNTTISLSGTFSPLTISSVNKNTIKSLQYQYVEDKSGYVYSTTKYSITKDTTKTGTNYSGLNTDINGTTGLDNQKQWRVKVLVTDELGTWSKEVIVPVGLPIMFIDTDKRSVGINKFPIGEGILDIEGMASISQGIYSNHNFNGLGNEGYLCVARITVITGYVNSPISFYIKQRGNYIPSTVTILFTNSSSTDPTVTWFLYDGSSLNANLVKVSSGVWDLYVQKTEAYDEITTTVDYSVYLKNKIGISYPNNFSTSITPTHVAQPVFNGSKATNGYQKLPNGLILQWGAIGMSSVANTTVSQTLVYPISFPNVCYGVFPNTQTGSPNTVFASFGNVNNSNCSAFLYRTDTVGMQIAWFAIGY